jgi:hypothetical protein
MAQVADLIGLGAPTTWLDNVDNVKIQPGDAADATRPDIWQYEGMKWSSSVGPNGEPGFDIMDSYGTDWRFCRVRFSDLGTIPAVSGDVWDATRGRFVQRHFIDSGVVGDADGLFSAGLDFLEVHSGDQRTDLGTILIANFADPTGSGANYQVSITNGATTDTSASRPFSELLDRWIEFDTRWVNSTTTSSADGSLSVRVRHSADGATWTDLGVLAELTGINTATNPAAYRSGSTVYGMTVIIGNQGIPGKFYYAVLYDTDSAAFEPPTPGPYDEIEDVSDPCCGSGSNTPTQGQTGDIPEVDPYGPYTPPTSTTTCVGGGTVPTASDLTDPEDWRTLLGATPNVLCELHAIKHPETLGETVYRWADQGLDLPIEPAHVEGRVRKGGWSEIRRAMPMPDQYPEVSRAGVTIDEQDALVRTLLDSESTAYLKGREYIQWLVSETRRKASGTMLALFRGVVAAFNPGPGRTYTIEVEDQLASPGGIFDLDKLLPQALIDHDFFGPGGDDGTETYTSTGLPLKGAHKDLIGLPIPILGGICSDRGATAANGDSAEKGAVPLIWVRDTYLPGHGVQVFGELLVGIGRDLDIEDVFGSDCGYDGGTPSDPPRPPRRININATVGVDLFMPSDVASWPFEFPYRTRTVNGVTLDYVAVYLRGPRMQHHRDGILTATANVCGPKGVNGNVITQVGPFLQWFYNEHVCANNGEGYRSGEYHTLQTYASDATVPYLQTSTFEAFQDYSEDRIDGGYMVTNFQLRARKSLREIERQFMQDYEVSLPFNRQGQKMLRWPNWQTDAETGTLYTERIDIDEPLPPYRDAHDEIENAVAFVCDYDHDLQTFRREAETLRDDDSISAHKGVYQGGKRLTDGQAITPLEVLSTGDVATVRDCFSRRLARKARAMRRQPVPTDLRGLYDELGDQIRITHSRGVGASGYAARPFQVIEHRIDPNTKHVTLDTMDLTRLRSGIGYAAEDSTPEWASATDDDKALFVYATEEDGTVDGTLGKRAA